MTQQDGVRQWTTNQVSDLISDVLHYLIADRKLDPEMVSEALVEGMYEGLFEAVVKAEAFAGRLPLGASSKSVKAVETIHEKVIQKVLNQALEGIRPGSRYIWTAWIAKRQKPT